jgi:hypothetical protein
MAQARKRSKGSGGKRRGSRAWTLVLLGIGIGAAIVLLWQLALRHADPKGGLANLRARMAEPAEKPAPPAPAKPAGDAAKTAKPKYDFYIILQEGETLVAERDPGASNRSPSRQRRRKKGSTTTCKPVHS